jgi:S1-C subfamily serine protease
MKLHENKKQGVEIMEKSYNSCPDPKEYMVNLKVIFFVFCLLILSIFSCTDQSSQQNLKSNQPKVVQTDSKLSAKTYSPQEIAQRVFSSVVLLVMADQYGQMQSLGSGFFIDKNVVATNYHVIEGAASGYVKPIGKDSKYKIIGTLGIDYRKDLAMLSVEGNLAPLRLNTSGDTKVGDPVYVIGNPQGLEGTFSQGIVSGIRKLGNDYILQITAPISPGSSGGPVLNERGEAIGVATATFKGGQNLNFAIPIEYFNTLIKNISVPIQLRPQQKSATIKSFLAEMGERDTAGLVAENFQWYGKHGDDNHFSISLRNKLQDSIKNVYALVIFYDRTGKPIDFSVIQYSDEIPAGLAVRSHGRAGSSVKRLTTKITDSILDYYSFTPSTKIEARILKFEFVK